MSPADSPFPDDVETLKRLVLARDAELARARAEVSSAEALIAHLRLAIEKMRRELYGQRSEREARLLDQMELQLEELVSAAAEDDLAAATATAAAGETPVRPHTRRTPSRKPFPAHLPRERIVVPGPSACACCGSGRLAKLGEDVTETLESVPRRWKVVQIVREKFTCRDCEAISQAPAPFHVLPRGFAGPSHGPRRRNTLHLPLNRQSAAYAREGIDLDVSTLADWVGAAAATLMPIVEALRTHVFAAARIHADDTPVPVQAKGKMRTGRLWTYVRDDRLFGGHDPPAAVFFYSPDRGGDHPEEHLARFAGLMQADVYAGFNRLYEAGRKPGPIVEAACWAHARRKFFELARIKKAPIAIEAVKRIDALFEIERDINGASADERRRVRDQQSRPLVAELHAWLRDERAKLSAKSETAKAIDYALKRWTALTRFLDDGRLCLSNNAAERALRGIAVGRHNWTFAGSDEGGRRAAAVYTLIETAKLNDIDPEAWLADVLARLPDHPAKRIHDFLPWNWKVPPAAAAA